MAVTRHTLTGDFGDIVGDEFAVKSVKAYLSTNLPAGQALVNLADNEIQVGAKELTLDSSGAFSVSLIASDSADTNIDSGTLEYRVTFSYVNPATRTRDTWDSSYFALTADADLSDVAGTIDAPIAWRSAFITDMEAIQAAAEAARDAAIDISNISTPDALVETLVLNTGGAGPLTSAAILASTAVAAKDPATPLGDVLARQNKNLEGLRAFIRAGGITTTNPFVAIGDSHTADLTSAQYMWDRLQNLRRQAGEGFEGVPAAAVIAKGMNGQQLSYYMANPTQTGGFDEAMALAPSVTVSCWLTNDVRLGGLGLTVDAIRVAGAALLRQHVEDIKDDPNRPQFIVLRVPAPYTTVNSGTDNYITDGTTVNPAGLAQIYTDGVRLAHYDVLTDHPDVLIYDPQIRLFGTTSPTSNDNTNGYFANQIHQSQKGYWAEGDDFAGWVGAAEPYNAGRSYEARRLTPATPWTGSDGYYRDVEDPRRYELVLEGAVAGTLDAVLTPTTQLLVSPLISGALPGGPTGAGTLPAGQFAPYDLMELVGAEMTYQLPVNVTAVQQAANVLLSNLSLGGPSVMVGTRVRLYRQKRPASDAAWTAVADDTSWRFKRFGRVVAGSDSANLYIDDYSITAQRSQQAASDWPKYIVSGDKVYVEGAGASPITLTTNFVAASSYTQVTGLSGTDWSLYVGKLVVIVGNHYGPESVMVNAVTASGAAQTLADPAGGYGLQTVTLTADCTLTFPKAVAGKVFRLALKQDATGSRLVTWPGTVKWAAATAPTLTTTAAKTDLLEFVCADGTNWIGAVLAQNT